LITACISLTNPHAHIAGGSVGIPDLHYVYGTSYRIHVHKSWQLARICATRGNTSLLCHLFTIEWKKYI